MRVLHCVPSMAGGGAERQLTYLSRELVRAGWDVHVAVIQGGPNEERLDATGAAVHRIRAFGNHDPLILARLIRVVRAVRPDVIQCWLLQMEVLGGLAAILTGTPWVFSERSAAAAYPPGAKTWLRVQVGRRAAAIVSNSSIGDHYWQARAGSGVKRFVIPNGLPLEEISATPPATDAEPGVSADEPVVLYAGRLSAEKNVETFIRALHLVAEERPVHGIVCGDGPLAERVSGVIAELELADQVRSVGYVPRLWSLMKRANALVSVSFFEGNPNVVLEAMACGCPLIVSDIPAHRELLDEGTALFVDPSRPRDVAAAIKSVLNDPARAAMRAQAALARVQAYALPRITERYAEVYRAIAAAGKR